MAKNLQSDVESLLLPFHAAVGNDGKYAAMCNQVAAFLGQLTITTVDGRWKCSAKFTLSSGDKNKAQMPPNDARSILMQAALGLDEVANLGNFTVNASIPAKCMDWVKHIKPIAITPTVKEVTAVK